MWNEGIVLMSDQHMNLASVFQCGGTVDREICHASIHVIVSSMFTQGTQKTLDSIPAFNPGKKLGHVAKML